MMISAWAGFYLCMDLIGAEIVRGADPSSSRFKCVTIPLHYVYVLGGTYEYI